MTDCPFCQRIEIGDHLGHMNNCVWFEPLKPVTPGHMLFVPRVHIPTADSDPMIAGRVFETAATWANQRAIDFNLITSSGPAATQTIRHLHIHYVPRRSGDGLHLPWTVTT
jgi:histidine triad (HIT) family protein